MVAAITIIAVAAITIIVAEAIIIITVAEGTASMLRRLFAAVVATTAAAGVASSARTDRRLDRRIRYVCNETTGAPVSRCAFFLINFERHEIDQKRGRRMRA